MRRVGLLAVSALAALSPAARLARSHRRPRTSATRTALSLGARGGRGLDYAAAEKALSAIQGADRPAALLALARIRFEQGRFAEADRSAQQASASQRPAARGHRAARRDPRRAGQGRRRHQAARPEQGRRGVGGRRVRLVLGELLIRAGRRADAEPVCSSSPTSTAATRSPSSDAEGLAMVGRAMHLLRHPKDANRAYNESERAERGRADPRVETLLWRADLYFDKYDPGHAEEVLAEALKLAPHRADAIVLLARVKLEEALRLRRRREARQATRSRSTRSTRAPSPSAPASRSATWTSPPPTRRSTPGSRSIRTTSSSSACGRRARFLADDKPGFEAAKREVFARNKEFSQAYGIIGDYAEWEHRYDDIVAMMKEAVALDPKDGKAWAQLGLTQTRAGDEADGRQVARDRVEGRPLQRPRLQHARDALHALDPAATTRARTRASSTSATRRTRRRSSSATCRGCSARRGAR